jgi:hypothetical protein
LLLHVAGEEVQDIIETFWSTVYSHETESFESLTMKLSIVSSSFCFAWRNTCLSNDMCFLGSTKNGIFKNNWQLD